MRNSLLINYFITGSSVNATYKWLVDNARAYWKFDGEGEITTQEDLTGNGWDLSPASGPFDFSGIGYYDYRYADYSRRGVYRAEANGLFLPLAHNTLLRQSHEFHIVCCGFVFGDNYLCGVINSTTVYAIHIDTSGRLVFRCRFASSGETTIRTVNGFIYGIGSNARRQYTINHIRVQVNFEADTLRIWINGAEFTTEFVSGVAISSWSPTYYVGGFSFVVGSYNNGNSSVGQSTYYRDLFDVAITDLLTDEKAWELTQYFHEN